MAPLGGVAFFGVNTLKALYMTIQPIAIDAKVARGKTSKPTASVELVWKNSNLHRMKRSNEIPNVPASVNEACERMRPHLCRSTEVNQTQMQGKRDQRSIAIENKSTGSSFEWPVSMRAALASSANPIKTSNSLVTLILRVAVCPSLFSYSMFHVLGRLDLLSLTSLFKRPILDSDNRRNVREPTLAGLHLRRPPESIAP